MTVLYSAAIEVRWRDLDAFDHVNNASYLGFVEEARVRWLQSRGADWAGAAAAPVVAAIAMNYRQPIGWPQALRIELHAERVGNKSLTLGHRILAAGEPATLFADGHSVLVWVDAGGRSVDLPAAVRAAVAAA